MTEEVDNPRELFAEIDADGIEDDEYTLHVADSHEIAKPDENGDIDRTDFNTVTVEFQIPEGERRTAALAELHSYSVRVEEPPFKPERTLEAGPVRFLISEAQVGYECVNGDKAGFVVVPPVEVVRVLK